MVYFYDDREIVVVPECNVISEAYGQYTREDWMHSGNSECRVSVLYNDILYDACVLQVREL